MTTYSCILLRVNVPINRHLIYLDTWVRETRQRIKNLNVLNLIRQKRKFDFNSKWTFIDMTRVIAFGVL